MDEGISTIIPTYNRCPFPAEEDRNPLFVSVYSLYEQTKPPKDVVIVDDCSDDNTPAVVERLKRDYPVRYLRMEERVGFSAARKAGLEEADNPFLLFMDDDSFPLTEYGVEHLQSNIGAKDVVVPPILFRCTELGDEVPIEEIGNASGFEVQKSSIFSSRPVPYSKIVDIYNLPGIFLAKKEVLRPEYFVTFSWPNNWGTETFLAWNLIHDGRELGYLPENDSAFIHLKHGWYMDEMKLSDEDIPTLPDSVDFRELLIDSNDPSYAGSRDNIRLEDWYRSKIAFSTLIYMMRGNDANDLSDKMEPFVRSDAFSHYGKLPDDMITDVVRDGIEMGRKEYETFFREIITTS
jgi:glycosyltransferase involved in cell wall biosynthesis